MIRKLFLESRALELAACFLEQAFQQDPPGTCVRPLSPGDRDRITHARDILVNRLQYPPAGRQRVETDLDIPGAYRLQKSRSIQTPLVFWIPLIGTQLWIPMGIFA